MCNIVISQHEMASTSLAQASASYSTFSIASLIGPQPIGDDDRATLIDYRSSDGETIVAEHPGRATDHRKEVRLAGTQSTFEAAITSLHGDTEDDVSGETNTSAMWLDINYAVNWLDCSEIGYSDSFVKLISQLMDAVLYL